MSFQNLATRCVVGLGVMAALTATAAAGIQTGEYRLFNHPDGNARPPLYGLRLDELFNATSGHDIFTFDFEAAGADVRMNFDGTSIHIHGVAYGGRDAGGTYANDAYKGFYTFDFLYNMGVGNVPGDDDTWVNTTNGVNKGWIQGPVGGVTPLRDERGGNPFSLRLGDENNDLGHRGFAGISGWGWITYDGTRNQHVDSSDFLFTAKLVPAPGAALLAVIGLAGLNRAKRRLD